MRVTIWNNWFTFWDKTHISGRFQIWTFWNSKNVFFEFFSTKTVLEVSLNFLEHTKKYLQAPGTPKLLLRRNKKTEKISLVISPEIFFMKTKFPLVISPETRYNKNYSITDFFESVRKTWIHFLNIIFLFQKTSFAPKICFQWKK